MSRLKHLSIRYKLLGLMLLVSMTVLILSTISYVYNDRQAVRENALEGLSSTAQVLAFNCASALVFDDADSAIQTLAALAAKPQVVGAFVYRANGQLLATYPPNADNLPDPHIEKEVQQIGSMFQDGRLHVSEPVMLEKERIGSVYLIDDLRKLNEASDRSLYTALAIFVGSVLIALLLATWLQRIVSRPILALTHAMNHGFHRSRLRSACG